MRLQPMPLAPERLNLSLNRLENDRPSRHLGAAQLLGRFRSEADINPGEGHKTGFMSTRSNMVVFILFSRCCSFHITNIVRLFRARRPTALYSVREA